MVVLSDLFLPQRHGVNTWFQSFWTKSSLGDFCFLNAFECFFSSCLKATVNGSYHIYEKAAAAAVLKAFVLHPGIVQPDPYISWARMLGSSIRHSFLKAKTAAVEREVVENGYAEKVLATKWWIRTWWSALKAWVTWIWEHFSPALQN